MNKIDFLMNNSSCYALFKIEATQSKQDGKFMWLLDYSKIFDFFS